MIFGGKNFTEHKMCFDFLYICLKHFSFYDELIDMNKMYIGLHVKYSLFLSDFNVTGIF